MKSIYLFFFTCFYKTVVYGQILTHEINLVNLGPTKPPVAIEMKGTNPDGETLSVNNRYFEKNGKAWFPVMGEMHYNRLDPDVWEQEIQKMKAGGLSIVASYIFWNEHETNKGIWDWKGNRDLRRFITLCQKNEMYVWLRIGPWSHGEQLHGGFPDWIQKMKGKRSNDPAYLAEATKLLNQVGVQASGLFFKDGGPVIGVQLENEYASGEAEHISELKKRALASKIEPVYWTVTANTVFDDTKMEVIPLQGAYPYRGWERGGGKATKDFLYANDQWIMTDALGKVYYDINKFPKGLCEQGCGSQMTYANRFIVEPHIVEAHLQNQVGRGMNLVGYYMFHGGTQTPGLKEPRYPESYDFQSPIGEYGYIRPSYWYLKTLHQFINDFGTDLAQMQVIEAENPVRDELDTEHLRYITRAKDNSGFIFLCNSQVRVTMPDKQVQLKIKLADELISLPTFTLKGQTSPILPFNLHLNNILLKYATAQPLAKINNGGHLTVFFQELPGVNPQIAIDASTIQENALKAVLWKKKEGLVVISPDKQKSVQLTANNGEKVTLVFLTRQQALQSWKIQHKGNEALVMTDADLTVKEKQIELRQLQLNSFTLSVYPSGIKIFTDGVAKKNRLYDKYTFTVKQVAVPVSIEKKPQADGMVINVPVGLPESLSDVVVAIDYLGGSCEARNKDSIAADHLMNGEPWLLGINKFLGKGNLTLQLQGWDDKITGVADQTVKEIKTKGPMYKTVKIIPQYSLTLNTK